MNIIETADKHTANGTFKVFLLTLTLSFLTLELSAQLEKASDNVRAWKVANCTVPFDLNYEGEPFHIRWGMDTAWDSESNIRRGIAFIGKNQIELARASFNPNFDMTSTGELSNEQRQRLNSRLNHIGLIGKHVEILLNDDPGDGDVKSMYKRDPKNWARLFDKTVEYAQGKGFNVVSIAPFNEPDYGWGQGTKGDFLDICKAVRSGEFPRLDPLRLCGGNTLNCDEALSWYNYLKPYLAEGNTHQLAGSFNNYANFFTQVKADGKIGTADELHNIMEAMVGVQYGMTQGIWWGFDGLARGEFCRASFGDRLAYAEDRSNWTAGSVYRNTLDNKYEAFVGTSERQANKSSYLFVSTAKDVYFDGYGPQREFLVQTPGGSGYQQGQTNAERVVNITFGEDVQPSAIDGTYILMNKASKMIMSTQNGSNSDGTPLTIAKNIGKGYQQWMVSPIDSAHGGDFSYYIIRGVQSNKVPDVWNWSLSSGGAVNLFNGSEGDNELYWMEYAGDGWYYIHSKHSNLVLGTNSTNANSVVIQQTKNTTEGLARNRQLWRFLPLDAECELVAPATPTGLEAQPLSASILLSWDANTEEDISGYTILRKAETEEEWNTIARNVKGCQFLDNLCWSDVSYQYKIKAVDKSVNTSEASEAVTARTSGEKKLICQLQFDKEITDASENHFDAAHYGAKTFSSIGSMVKSGTSSLSLDGKKYVQLPYSVANQKEMTICGWIKLASPTTATQRFFEFGSGTDKYMCVIPNSGSDMRLVLKCGEVEEVLSAKKVAALSWKHIAVTFSDEKVSFYVDGELAGESSEMHIRPADIQPVMCYLGRGQSPKYDLMKGYLDDFRIYNYPLSQQEIKDIIDEATGVEAIQASSAEEKGQYNLQGIKVGNDYRGIVVKEGKKEFRKLGN